ncbi:MAG: hypothetical protein KC591_08090 [Gemmatimonadetes bacterium]|nr:hypothetical protein [Gemmatimonadota bacterium]
MRRYIALALLLGASAARADVLLNEMTIQGSEWVELFNSGLVPVDVNGWTIRAGGSYEIAGTDAIPAGGYLVVEVPGDVLDDQGGFIELLDGVVGEDAVSYGQQGSAPLPPGDFGLRGGPASLARAPDGSALGVPPSPSPSTDGMFWTIDFSPTPGLANDAPVPALGTTVRINEVDPKPLGADVAELYDPLAVPVDVTGWILCDGDDIAVLAGVVPAGGFLALPTGLDFDTNEVAYLFRDDGTRVDQLGFHLPPVRNAPFLDYCQCYARWPDGAGPDLGYDWFSSGGETTLFRLVCTHGASNAFVESCATTSAPEITPGTWGHTKNLWR